MQQQLCSRSRMEEPRFCSIQPLQILFPMLRNVPARALDVARIADLKPTYQRNI
jgi:hypothetical protein